jgi:predicted  nucleic acid-binding Zn-ribbon protein
MRELVKTQELELTRLRGLVEDSDAAALESSREAQSLKQDLEDAQHERHKLEDQLELLQQEIERMRDQVRELQRAKQESENLAESEVRIEFYCSWANGFSNSGFSKRIASL